MTGVIAALLERLHEPPVGVVALVGDDGLWADLVEQRLGLRDVAVGVTGARRNWMSSFVKQAERAAGELRLGRDRLAPDALTAARSSW